MLFGTVLSVLVATLLVCRLPITAQPIASYLCTDPPVSGPTPGLRPSYPTSYNAYPWSQKSTSADDIAAQTLSKACDDIIALIEGDETLVPAFLRMEFHDCVGGCDGCVDLTNPDNNGILRAIETLASISQEYATSESGVTRADLWALAAVVAVEVGNHVSVTTPISFTMPWYGRKNCEDLNPVCVSYNGQEGPCTATLGPHRSMPSVNFKTADIFGFFAQEFGFNERETVSIMGAHNVGQLRKEEVGIEGEDGFVPLNTHFVNEYYRILLGSISPNDINTLTASELWDASPPWEHDFDNNTGVYENYTGTPLPLPSRWYWTLPVGNKHIAMTHADISLVRHLDDSNMDSSGHVSCAYKNNDNTGESACPFANTISIAAEYLDNDVWLNEFRSVLDRMVTNGYTRPSCDADACQLIPN